jgi:pimeloyl-ACP methyl ester carboxylesterase
LEQLSPAERRVAEQVLADPGQVVVLSISDLATRYGVAQPTLSRFARSVGFDSYPSLRFAIAHDIATEGEADRAPVGSSLDRLRDELASDSAIAELARLLRRAPAAELWASPEFAGTADLLAARLQRAGVPAAATLATSYWTDRANGLRPGSVVIALGADLPPAARAATESRAAVVVPVVARSAAHPTDALTVVMPSTGSPELTGALLADVLLDELASVSERYGPDGPADPWLAWPHVERFTVETDDDPVPVILLRRDPESAAPLVIFFNGFTAEKEQGLPPGVERNRVAPGIVTSILNGGCDVLLVDAPAHGDRKRAWETPRDLVRASLEGEGEDLSALARATAPHLVDAVLARGLAGGGSIAVVGQSWGGYQALLTLEGDPRIVGAVGIMPVVHPSVLPEFSPYRDAPRGRAAELDPARLSAARSRPILLVAGLDDHVTPPETIRELHRGLTSAYADPAALRLEELPAVGHQLAEQQIDLLVDWLRAHLAVAG